MAALLYNKMTSFDLHDEIERDNTAVGMAFAGVLIGFGNIIRLAGEGDFVSWTQSLSEFGYYAVVGLLLLPLVRLFADKVLLPGARLTDELVQDVPNVGAGAIEATTYPRRVNTDRVDPLRTPATSRRALAHGVE